MDRNFYISLFFMVTFAYSTQVFTTKAVLIKKPSFIMPFGYLSIILSALIDIFYFGHQFNFLSLFGMILAGSGLLIKLLIHEDDT